MTTAELAEVRALLTSKPRPEGWSERRQRLDEVGSVWPVADDITLSRLICKAYQASGRSPREVMLHVL
jgi:epsilon-lactone hydrolase